jgi:serine/threonine protein kinase
VVVSKDDTIEDGFEKLLKIGEGSYGVVYSAVDRRSKRKVALKRIRLDQSGFEIFHSLLIHTLN